MNLQKQYSISELQEVKTIDLYSYMDTVNQKYFNYTPEEVDIINKYREMLLSEYDIAYDRRSPEERQIIDSFYTIRKRKKREIPVEVLITVTNIRIITN